MKIDTCYFSLSPSLTAAYDLIMAVPFSKVTSTRFFWAREGHVSIDSDDWWAVWRHPPGQTWMTEQDGSLGLDCSYPGCLSQSDDLILIATIPPGRLLHSIAPLELISAWTYVERSNTCVSTFHTAHSCPPRNYSCRLCVEGRLIAL